MLKTVATSITSNEISSLSAATTPLSGKEVLPIVQGGAAVQVSVSNLTAGRAISATSVAVGVAAPASGTTIEARNAAAGTAIRASNSGGGFIEIACESNATSNAQLNYTNQLTATGGNIVLSGADFRASTAGKGLILTNAAGTVTKRVRLNDAGDGLVFENP